MSFIYFKMDKENNTAKLEELLSSIRPDLTSQASKNLLH